LGLSDDVATTALDADFRAVFDASPRPLLLLAADPPKFTMVAINTAHAQAFATTPEALQGWGVLEVFPADPPSAIREFMDAIRNSMDRVLATRAPDQMEIRPYPVQTPEGANERYWSAINSPVFDSSGAISHIVSAVQDVTGEVFERRSEEARNLLMGEVDHRARNALTVVQSLIQLTEARDLADFKATVLGRVEALARAQTSLARRKWEGAHLRDILSEELAAMAGPEKYEISGPNLLLPAEHVQAMSMALHELATNAMKYGALKTDGGKLSVTWTASAGQLTLVWSEDCGRAIALPASQGFGSRLLERLTKQLGGQIKREWRPRGLRVELTAET
jgi:two-component sensor histidine kinase